MDMQLEKEGENRLLLTCSGDIGWEDRDLLVETIREALEAAGPPQILMDIESVSFVNSAGIGALFQLTEMVRERNGRLVMAKVPPSLDKLFRTVGLNRLVPLVETAAEARTLLNQPG